MIGNDGDEVQNDLALMKALCQYLPRRLLISPMCRVHTLFVDVRGSPPASMLVPRNLNLDHCRLALTLTHLEPQSLTA